MARRITDANELLNDLLDPSRTRLFGLPSVVTADDFMKKIAKAEEVGAVSLGRGAEQVAHVGLRADDTMYRHLGGSRSVRSRRTPSHAGSLA